MESRAILAIDQGTHASRAGVFDPLGQMLSYAEQAVSLQRHNDVEVEQDAMEILRSVRTVIDQVTIQSPQSISIAGLATQRSTLVAWDKSTGEPLAPAISWQDRRSAGILLAYSGHSQSIEQITGLVLSPHYLAGKILWLLQHNPAVRSALKENRLAIGPLSSFLCFHLLENQPYVVDHSNAGRSLLFDICARQWSSELLSLFAIPENLLPECVATLTHFGTLNKKTVELACVCGDQNAALYGHELPDRYSAVVNIGSGAFILCPSGERCEVKPGLLTGIASSEGGRASYLLEGTVNGAGTALSVLQTAWPGIDIIGNLPGWLDEVQHPPVCINGSVGLGSPWWIDKIDSRFIPSTDDCAAQAVALVESIVFMLVYNLQMMDKDSLERIIISGGLSQMDGLCQLMADLSGLPVVRYSDSEATLRGIAHQLTINSDRWNSDGEQVQFQVKQNNALQYRYQRFVDELEKVLS